MLLSKKLILLALSLFTLSLGAISQDTLELQSNGYVNFNLGTSTLSDTTTQTLSLYGCNTVLTDKSVLWNGPSNGFVWDSTNQILSDVPFGNKIDPLTNQPYYVYKYYIASPPVFHKNSLGKTDSNTVYDIGIVTPDEFIFNGEQPVQRAFLDYNILELTQIDYINVVFDSSFQKLADSLNHTLNLDCVPFKVECTDFRWLDTLNMYDASGASGIGSIQRDSTDTAQLFLPYPKLTAENPTKNYLNCKVTILNDILFHYEVYFVCNGNTTQFINLRDHQLHSPNAPITLHCEYRDELPCGCLKPKRKPKNPYRKD
ncbi:MAG: hypothetical protein P8P74_07970 [Crocinitomicaceae bacterium]|nr:hypothetical protein [Crocinitomicaceae bacterium]